MLSVTIEGKNPEALLHNLDELSSTLRKGLYGHPKPEVKQSATIELKEVSTLAPTQGPAPEPTCEVTVGMVQEACRDAANTVGMPRVKEVISSFGVSKVGDLPADKRAELIEKVKALV